VGTHGELETRSRLSSVLAVCEHEKRALEALEDDRLDGALCVMTALRAEIVAARPALNPTPARAPRFSSHSLLSVLGGLPSAA
jgi:hypothetical protein